MKERPTASAERLPADFYRQEQAKEKNYREERNIFAKKIADLLRKKKLFKYYIEKKTLNKNE